MPDVVILLLAVLFIPLFPLGMVFNIFFQRSHHALLRSLLLITWPLAGLGLLYTTAVAVPEWFVMWALFTAILYGFRAVVIREVGVWVGFLATSAWSLMWVALVAGIRPEELLLHALAFSSPLVLIVFMVAELECRYESAYAGIVSGIALAQPRLAVIFVIAMLAAIGSPLFPAFFTLINSITRVVTVFPVAAFGIAMVWLLWSWSGIQILQRLLVGTVTTRQSDDITRGLMVTYGLLLLALFVAGLYVSRIMI